MNSYQQRIEQNANFIRHLTQTTPNNGNELGWHGTSLETLEYAIKSGFIPGSQTINEGAGVFLGDIYLVRLNGCRIIDNEISTRELDYNEFGIKMPKKQNWGPKNRDELFDATYQSFNYPAHATMKAVGLEQEIANKHPLFTCMMESNMTKDSFKKWINLLGLNKEIDCKKAFRTFKKMQTRAGVVISFKKEIQEHYEVFIGNEDDWQIRTNNEGLPIKFIEKIYLLCPKTKKDFQKLFKQYTYC